MVSGVKILTQKDKKYENTRQHDSSKTSNTTVTHTDETKVDESSNK
jgi:hypothetical protein